MSAAKKPRPDDPPEEARARSEALALVDAMEHDLRVLSGFVAEERRAAKRRAPAPKRVARLRLVSEDIASAARLSAKTIKS